VIPVLGGTIIFQKIIKKSVFKKLRYFYHDPTRRETQFTKVLSILKRFGRHLQDRGDNDIFRAKISLICSSLCVPSVRVWHWNTPFFTQKMRLSSLSYTWRPDLFRSETTLVRCVFPRGWIVVKVWQRLNNQHFHEFLKNFGGGPPRVSLKNKHDPLRKGEGEISIKRIPNGKKSFFCVVDHRLEDIIKTKAFRCTFKWWTQMF